jgi:hypothetical protein
VVSSHAFSDLSVNSEYFQKNEKNNDMSVSERIDRKESIKKRNDLQHVSNQSMSISYGDNPEYSIEMKRISKEKEASNSRSR